MQSAIIFCFTAFAGVMGSPAVLTSDVFVGEPLEIFNPDLDISMTTLNASEIAANNYCVAEHNRYRAENGLEALIADSRLEAAARFHNEVMVSQNCFSHQCPGEPPFGERIRQQGYSWSGAAENLALGTANCDAALRAWMNSEGHKRNILGNYRHIGCHKLNLYYTCNFARPW